MTFPGWRDERTEPFRVDCPLSARRETAPPLLRVTVRALEKSRALCILFAKGGRLSFETVQI